MGLRFRGKNLAFRARLFAQSRDDGSFGLGGIMESPRGNFAVNLPPGRFPIDGALRLPGDPRGDRLNALGELVFILRGEPWTVATMTIHELRLEGDRLHARIDLQLVHEDGSTEDTTLKLANEKVLTEVPPPTDGPPPRSDTFDLREGLGRLRWDDDRAAVERSVYNSEWRGPGTALDGQGKRVRWPAGLSIPTFLMIFTAREPTLWFSAFARFGKDERVSGVTLFPYGPTEMAHSGEMLSWIVDKLGMPRSNETEKTWTRGAVTVALAIGTDGFRLALERANSTSAPRRTRPRRRD